MNFLALGLGTDLWVGAPMAAVLLLVLLARAKVRPPRH
jgi:hypothetical protein